MFETFPIFAPRYSLYHASYHASFSGGSGRFALRFVRKKIRFDMSRW